MRTRRDSGFIESVRQARRGVASAWREIDRLLRDEILAKLPLPPCVDPEEVASDTIGDVWRALRSLRDEQRFVNFAMTVARRVAARKYRESRRYERLREEPSVRVEDVGPRNLASEELLSRLSRSLRGADRKLFRLLFITGASDAEMESALGVSPVALRQRKHVLRRKLQRASSLAADLDLGI